MPGLTKILHICENGIWKKNKKNNNYPKKEYTREIEGKVHIIFKLRLDGSIKSIESGPNTKANANLIKAAIKSVKNSGPFEKIALLEKKKEFSIMIIYKINR